MTVTTDSVGVEKKITVVIPAYQEAKVIGQVVTKTLEVLAAFPQAEVLVVDDASTDDTGRIAEQAGARVIRHPYNKGNGAAIKTGIRAAQGDVIVFMDGDGQHDPADIPRLVEPIGVYDMVIGARSPRSYHDVGRKNANRAYNVLASYICGAAVLDLTSGFRAVRADLARKFCHLLPNTFSYPSTMTIVMFKAGYNVKFVPIEVGRRVGQSKINIIRDGFRFLTIIFKVAVLFEPLKVFLPIGIVMLLPGLVLGFEKLVTGRSWTIAVTASLSIGALIIVLGLISEQIAMLRTVQFDR